MNKGHLQARRLCGGHRSRIYPHLRDRLLSRLRGGKLEKPRKMNLQLLLNRLYGGNLRLPSKPDLDCLLSRLYGGHQVDRHGVDGRERLSHLLGGLIFGSYTKLVYHFSDAYPATISFEAFKKVYMHFSTAYAVAN